MTQSIPCLSLHTLPPNASIGIYGTGERGRDLHKAITVERPDITVTCFLDSFKAGTLMGLPVWTPETLLAQESPPVVMVASHFADQIVQGLSGFTGQIMVADQRITDRSSHRHGKGKLFQVIGIEPLRLCNMACDFCLHRKFYAADKYMDMGLYETIIRDMAENRLTRAIELTGMGEPLMHPNIMDMARLASENDIYFIACTNGILLTPDTLDQLALAGTGRLFISLQTISENSFRHRHCVGGLKFADYLDQFMAVMARHATAKHGMELKIRLMYSHPDWTRDNLWNLSGITEDTLNARTNFIALMKRLEETLSGTGVTPDYDLDEFDMLFERIVKDEGGAYEMSPVFDNVSFLLTSLDQCDPVSMQTLCKERIDDYDFTKNPNPACTLTYSPLITYDGDILPCCVLPAQDSHYAQLKLGNISEDNSLSDIFTSKRFKQFLHTVETGKAGCEFCTLCMGSYDKRRN